MKIAVVVSIALAGSLPASAGSFSAEKNSPPGTPAFSHDLRLRDAQGRVRSDLLEKRAEVGPNISDQPPAQALPAPATPPPPAMVLAPEKKPLAEMPMLVVDGVEIDPKMPMKAPDPTVDYKLHVLNLTKSAGQEAHR